MVEIRPNPTFEALAALNKAAGDPLRLEILRLLATNSYGVLELSEAFEVKQSGMSHHLKVLASAGLVATRKEGNSVFYRRPQLPPSDALNEHKRSLFNMVDNISLQKEVSRRLVDIHKERALASERFFVDNTAKFREQQDLIADYPVYGDQVRQILDNTKLPHMRKALEVGPGEGHFLAELAKRFDQVDGLDNSGSMLEKAADLVHKNSLTNVSLNKGDASDLSPASQYDCAVLNMVLHHTPSPADIFLSVSQAVNTGGAVIVCDLCEHDQAWVKETCGDIWQGFQAEDLNRWASDAGLQEKQSVFIALRNGFQIQIKQYQKL